jgi:uncharacterized protein
MPETSAPKTRKRALPKPRSVVDRDNEWAALSRLWQSARSELGIVLGRRRTGKSFLLAPFAEAVDGIYYQATLRTEAEQLLALTRLVGEHYDDAALLEGAGLPTWESLFRYLLRKADGKPLLFVLDEFPYLQSAAPALPSILQAMIDHELKASRLKLVLCGSHITAMRQLEAADQPLYARRTARLHVGPFEYDDAALFMKRWDALDKLRGFGVFGGMPGHLALIDARRSLRENVAAQLVDPGARLSDEAQHMLDAFLGDAAVHYSIIDAIAHGENTWSGITSRVGKTAGSLSRPMTWLLEMEIVERVVPISETRPEKSKRALYRISDHYVRFWHRFVSPLIQAGVVRHVAPLRLVKERIEPALDNYMGPVFESTCRAFVRKGRGVPFEPSVVGEWWSGSSDDQVDVVALSDGEMLVGECKWGRVDQHDLASLRRRAALVMADVGSQKAVHLALFSATDKADDVVRSAAEAGEVLYFNAADLLSSQVRRRRRR